MSLIFVFSGAASAAPPEYTRAEFSAKLSGWLKRAKNPGGPSEESDSFALTKLEDTDALLLAMEKFPLTPVSTQKVRAEVVAHPGAPGSFDRLMKAPASDPSDLLRATRILVWSADSQGRDAGFKHRSLAMIAHVMRHEAEGPSNSATAVYFASALELLGEKKWIAPNFRADITRLSEDVNRFQVALKKRVEAKDPNYLALALDEMKTCTPLVQRAASLLGGIR